MFNQYDEAILQSFQQMIWRYSDFHTQNNKLRSLPQTYEKINFKWLINLNARVKYVNLLEINRKNKAW